MKKIILAASFLIIGLCVRPVRAEDPKLFVDFGQVKFYVPLTSVDAVYQWDVVNKRSLVGGETQFASIHDVVQLTAGAVTSLNGLGSPFLGARLGLANPLASIIPPLAAIRPGLFGGYDFNGHSWIAGFKVTSNIF